MKWLILALASTGCAGTFGQGWKRSDTAAHSAFAAELIADGAQTMTYVTPACIERNPVIGKCGDRLPIPLYIPIVFALGLVSTAAIPPRWRPIVEGILLGYEGGIVYTNQMTIHEQGLD